MTASPPCILVVDDEPDTLGLVQLTLETAGYRVSGASSGGEALLQAQQQAFDLILLDVMMPDLSGLEVYRRLQATLTTVPPVIFLTAKNRPEDREAGEGLGAAAYLVKPITRGQLLDVLRRNLHPSR
jgi:DNA-binding response OmpR family regulator